jgi:DUF1680 family protein
MPWEGDLRYTLTPSAPVNMTLRLRIPEWSLQTKVSINGVPYSAKVAPNCYIALKRTWRPDDVVTIEFDLTPHRVAANPCVPGTGAARYTYGQPAKPVPLTLVPYYTFDNRKLLRDLARNESRNRRRHHHCDHGTRNRLRAH